MPHKSKILHIAPANISGVPGQFVQTERQLGYESRLVTLFADPRNYFQDICLNLPFIDFAPTKMIKRLVSDPRKLQVINRIQRPENIPLVWQPHSFVEKALVFFRDWWWRPRVQRAIKQYHLDEFDVYQLDGGLDFYRNAAFISTMKERGKKIICCYTGSDLRTRGVIQAIDRISEANVTVEFDHLSLHPAIQHVFFPFDASRFTPHAHHNNSRTIVIGHAPTNRAAKGSDIIIPILQRLSRDYPVKIELIEGLPYREALARKQACDIFVDQIGDLGYGINSLEAMAMEIPACSCLAPGFAAMYPDHAFVEIHAENLAEQIIPLIENANLRRKVGERGRQWVLEHHDAVKVVQKIHAIAGIN
ncbi:glycosyltransferase family 1 protein [candidate division KSB1 bacterium]|nr:glycosyltransferase [candidate division KSB1 bacterium]RQW06915.1 MAG: glycosyltransferase family 1 protein [candidate division KSB1 bacterium]